VTALALSPAGYAPQRVFAALDAGWEEIRSYARVLMSEWQRERTAADRSAELALVRRVRRGDARAQTELVEHLLPHVRAVANALLGASADADDAVQIGLMRVLEGLATWRGDASLHRWARKVAAHACLRLSEQNRRHARVVAEADATDAAAPWTDAGFRDALPRPVAEYLDRLPPAQREAVVLRHALDHSVAEIAELTGVPVDTVKSRLLFGRRALRKLIRRDENVGELATALRKGARA
jgi:RNA polymerase sigma-70 factor (ECF subfamily)